MQTLLLILPVSVYNDRGWRAARFDIGQTLRGKYDPFVGGWVCFVDGIEFAVFRDEAIAC
jgi:hypothetical protein